MLPVEFEQLVEEHPLALCDRHAVAPMAGTRGDTETFRVNERSSPLGRTAVRTEFERNYWLNYLLDSPVIAAAPRVKFSDTAL